MPSDGVGRTMFMKGSTNEHGASQNTINSIKKQENLFQNIIVNVKVKAFYFLWLIFTTWGKKVQNVFLGKMGSSHHIMKRLKILKLPHSNWIFYPNGILCVSNGFYVHIN